VTDLERPETLADLDALNARVQAEVNEMLPTRLQDLLIAVVGVTGAIALSWWGVWP